MAGFGGACHWAAKPERLQSTLKRLPIFSFAFAAPAAGRGRALDSRCAVPGRHRLNWQPIGLDDLRLARSGRSPQPPCNSFRSDLTSSDQLCTGRGQGRHPGRPPLNHLPR